VVLSCRIENWIQVLAVVEFVGSAILFASFALTLHFRDLTVAFFSLWMGVRL
jgi:hypothetical protein